MKIIRYVTVFLMVIGWQNSGLAQNEDIYQEINNLKFSFVNDIAWSPDGSRLAIVEFPSIHLINTTSLTEDFTIQNASVSKVAWNYQGDMIASISGGSHQSLFIWDIQTGKLIKELIRTSPDVSPEGLILSYRLSWSPNGNWIASDSDDRELIIWDIDTNTSYVLGSHTQGRLGDSEWSPDSKYLASVGGDLTLRIWDLNTSENIIAIEGVAFIDWHPIENKVAGISLDDNLIIWDANTGNQLSKWYVGNAVEIKWNFDGTLLAIGFLDGKFKILDAKTGLTVATPNGHTDSITALDWHPTQNTIASSDYTGQIIIWKINTREE